jgi:hypothetical protein
MKISLLKIVLPQSDSHLPVAADSHVFGQFLIEQFSPGLQANRNPSL